MFVYLDDIIVVTPTFEKHLEVLQEVFTRLRQANLGYLVTGEGIQVDPDKVQAILDLTARFVPNFASLTEPINKLLRKSTKFQWTSECDEAFKDLKTAMISAPVLSCPNFDAEFILHTDASGYGLGGVLVQKGPNDEHSVICYLSRSLTRRS